MTMIIAGFGIIILSAVLGNVGTLTELSGQRNIQVVKKSQDDIDDILKVDCWLSMLRAAIFISDVAESTQMSKLQLFWSKNQHELSVTSQYDRRLAV